MTDSGVFAPWRKRATGRSTAWNKAALAAILAIFCVNVYRAVTQSLTTDEAFTYQRFIGTPSAGLLAPFDANNHVLNSLLSKVAISIFGLSEWSLRLPSLIGGAIYLLFSYRLCFRIFGARMWSFLTMALLTTEPLLMDHLSAARGYGLALGFTMAALDELVLCMETRPRRSWYAAGICLGLSVSSNLAWLFPAAGIGLATIAVAAMEGDFRFDRFWSELFVPAWLSAFVLLVLPLSKARPEQFYFGAKRFSDFVRSMLDGAFSHGTVPLPWTTDLDYALDLLKIAVRPVLLGILVLCAAFVLQGLRRSAPPKRVSGVAERRAFFFATSLLAVLALLFAAHVLAGVAYPLSRTGLYFVPLVILATSSTVYVYRGLRPVSGLAGAVSTICLVAFLLQSDTSYYAEWRFDAGTKRIVNLIRFRWPPQPRRTIRATWDLEPTLNFYRLLYGLDWDPIDRGGVDRPGDVFILTTEDQTPERVSRLRVVYRDTVSRTLVALPQEAKASGK